MTPLELSARHVATAAHARFGQRRRYTNEPYIVHPAEVAEIVRSVPHTEAMLCAAWLHDVVEDCDVSFAAIRQGFGTEVAQIVAGLTKIEAPPGSTRAARAALQLHHLALGSAAVHTVKLADLISNCSTLAERDPTFAAIYFNEKRAQLAVLSRGDATLRARAEVLLAQPDSVPSPVLMP